MYAMVSTRPYLAFIFNTFSQIMTNARISHWKIMKRVMKYVQHTQAYALWHDGSITSDFVKN